MAGICTTAPGRDSEYNCPYDLRMKINWDPIKAAANEAAHGVKFADAATVLEDELALTREDPDAIGEQRFATLGRSGEGKPLVVIYTYRDPDVIRIISAWKANRRQRVRYEEVRG
jgi:uncharacterized protein